MNVVARDHRLVLSMLGCAIVMITAGCGPSPRFGTVSATTSTARPVAPLVAILDTPFGATPNTLRLVGMNGAEVTNIALRADAEAITVAGPRVLIAGGGRLDAMDRTGADTELGAIPDDTGDDLVRGLVASPDGSQWIWASLRVMPGGGMRSRIYVDDGTAPPRLVLERTEAGRSLQPVAWTAAGPVISDEADGIGGYVLFRRSFGPASRLDLATGTLTQVTSDSCAFNDLSASGAVACVVDSREGPNDGGTVRLTVQHAGGAPAMATVPLSLGIQQAGDALFQPQGRLISIASSPALGQAVEAVTTGFVDVHSGALQPVAFNGLAPVQWIDPSSLLLTRDQNIAGGPPGTYVGRLTGTTVMVSPHPYALGVVR